MKNEEKKREFDLSKLTYSELLEVYKEINNFLKTLKEEKLDIEVDE